MVYLMASVNWIADAVFFGLVGAAMVAGLIGGLSRALKGFFAAVFIIFASVMLVGACITPMCETPVADKISTSIEQKAEGWGEAFCCPVGIDEDGSYYVTVERDGQTENIPLSEIGDNGLADKTKAALAQRLAERFVTEENAGVSLARLASNMITTIVIGAIAFVGIALGLGLLFVILRFVFRRAPFENGVLGAINKLLGMAVAGFMAMVFLFIVMAVLYAFHIKGVDAYMATSPAAGYLYFHNPLGAFITRIFG